MSDYYDIGFLETDWDGAGLDLQYTVVLRDEHRLAASLNTVMAALLYGANVERWDGVPAAGTPISGSDLRSLLRFLERSAVSNVTVWASLPGEVDGHFHIEVVAPDQISVGAASAFFYTGSTTRDLSRVGAIVERVALVGRECGPSTGSFAVAEQAERLAEQRASEGSFEPPWNDTKREAVAQDVWRILRDFRPG